jgi:hypothetical protein
MTPPLTPPRAGTLIYKAALALQSGPHFHPYDSTDILAATESDAKDRAWEWVRQPEREVDQGSRLVVTISGKSILNEPLDWSNPPRD